MTSGFSETSLTILTLRNKLNAIAFRIEENERRLRKAHGCSWSKSHHPQLRLLELDPWALAEPLWALGQLPGPQGDTKGEVLLLTAGLVDGRVFNRKDTPIMRAGWTIWPLPRIFSTPFPSSSPFCSIRPAFGDLGLTALAFFGAGALGFSVALGGAAAGVTGATFAAGAVPGAASAAGAVLVGGAAAVADTSSSGSSPASGKLSEES